MEKHTSKNNIKKRDNQNVLTIIIAIIVLVVLIVLYVTWNKKGNKLSVVNKKKPIKIDPRYIRLYELEKQRDALHLKRYTLYQKLYEFNLIERWCEGKIDSIFKFGRWILFLFVLTGFITTRFEPINFLGCSTGDFLKGINAVAVIIFLLYFASSDANDSLMKCYHNSKPATAKFFMYSIYWYYKRFYKIQRESINDLKNRLNLLFIELKPVIDEIRILKKELNIL